LPTPDSLRIHGAHHQLLRRRSFDRHMGWDAQLPAELVERLWQDPRALVADGSKLQDKPRCTVVRIDHPAGPFVLKRHSWGNFRRTMRRSLSRSAARKSWIDGRDLATAGIPTPLPRAYVERRFGPFCGCSYLLTDYVPGTSLYRLMRFDRPPMEVVTRLARQVAAIWERLDELRVCHNDLKTENLLVDPQGKVWLIDLERTRRFARLEQARRRQVRDANDLLHPRNWRSDPGAAEVFRREILQTAAAAATLAGPQGAAHPLSRPVSAANRPSQLVTVLIPCRNAAGTIGACVDSVRDMADEILVADAGSTDDTLEVVRQAGGCRIIERQCDDEVEFENWARGAAAHPWILRILPNERLNPELGRQVQDVLATEPNEDAFWISRAVLFRGQRLNFGGFDHDASLRLYRRDAGRYALCDGRVEMVVAQHKTGRIESRLFHESFSTLERRLGEMIRIAAQSAQTARQQGLRPKRRAILWQAPWQFIRSYFLRFGWLDGWAGLHACWLSALSICLRDTMLWEMDQAAAAGALVVRETRQTLKVFDPQGGGDRATPAPAGAAEQDQDAPTAGSDQRLKRPAA
jgi:hypothetical protein